jgi:predicted RNase H-like nuclease (RuvC/YqgF family)
MYVRVVGLLYDLGQNKARIGPDVDRPVTPSLSSRSGEHARGFERHNQIQRRDQQAVTPELGGQAEKGRRAQSKVKSESKQNDRLGFPSEKKQREVNNLKTELEKLKDEAKQNDRHNLGALGESMTIARTSVDL